MINRGFSTLGVIGLKRSLRALVTVGVVAAAMAPAVSVSADMWQAYTYWGTPTVIGSKGFRKITEEIEKASAGEVKIKFNLGGTLSIAGANINGAVRDDVVQIADDAFYQGTVPIAGLSSLPFLLRSQAEMPKVMEILWPLVERDYAKNGVTVLGYYAYPEQVFWFRGNVSSLADIVGKKVRITSPEQGGMVRAFGGMPVQIGSAEVPAALERGVVDGILTASAGGIMAWKELLKSSYTMGLNYPVSFVVVNTERFKKLPPALQTKVRDIVRDNTRELTTELQREDGELRKKFSTEGISLHTPKPAEMAAAAAQSQQIWKTWADARGAEGVQTLERVRKVLGR